MLKKVSKITALVLCAALVVAAAAYPAGLYLRGNLDEDKYPLPQAFPQWIGEADGALADGADTRLMTSNVQVHYGKDWGGTDAHMRARMFFALLDVYQPDVVGIQEMSGQWHAAIARNGGSYEMLYQFTTGLLVRMTSMIYNTDTLELIDQGQFKYSAGENPRLRRVVWGVFERKDNGKRFAVTSTHFSVIREGREEEERADMHVQADELTELADQLQEAYGCPVFLLGDYNSRDGALESARGDTTVYERLDAQWVTAKTAAREAVHGDAKTLEDPSVDHIFLCGEAEFQRYTLFSDAIMEEMSDHFPVMVDVTL